MPRELYELGERIAENAAHIDAAMHRLLADLREFDAREGWGYEGAISCAHWLSWRVGWDLATARDRVRVARRLGELPEIDQALGRGEISYSQARAMVRVGTTENQATLLEWARHATAAQLEKICSKYSAVRRAATKERDGDPPRRYMNRRTLDDGMVRIECVLRAEEAELVWQTVTRAAREVSAETFDHVDGLVALAQAAARGESLRTPVEVMVTVPMAALVEGDASGEVAEVGDRDHVSAETARRLTCDAGVVDVVESETGEILSVGRKRRTIPSAIKRALRHRDGHCRFPGCNNRVFLDGHHLKHWAEGGETKLSNLVSLCSHHHRYVHEQGYRVELDAEQNPIFYKPSGRRLDDCPPRPPRPGLGLDALRLANADLGITPATNECHWDGARADYGLCVDGLVRLDHLN